MFHIFLVTVDSILLANRAFGHHLETKNPQISTLGTLPNILSGISLCLLSSISLISFSFVKDRMKGIEITITNMYFRIPKDAYVLEAYPDIPAYVYDFYALNTYPDILANDNDFLYIRNLP